MRCCVPRRLVAQPQKAQLRCLVCHWCSAIAKWVIAQGSTARCRHLINRGHGSARTNLACIHLIVVEILAVQCARLVADQSVFRHGGGVPFHLDFHIIRNRKQRAGQLIHQHFAGFIQRIDIGSRAVAVLRQRLHDGVVQIAATKAQNRQVNPGIAFLGDIGFQAFGVVNADVEIAIGGQQDTADFAVAAHGFGHVISQRQPFCPGGGTTCRKVLQCSKNFGAVLGLGRL